MRRVALGVLAVVWLLSCLVACGGGSSGGVSGVDADNSVFTGRIILGNGGSSGQTQLAHCREASCDSPAPIVLRVVR